MAKRPPSRLTTVPMSLTMPVNMLAFRRHQVIRSGRTSRDCTCVKWPPSGQPIKSFVAERHAAPSGAGDFAPLIDHRLVDQTGVQEGAGDRRAALDQHARDAARRQRLECVVNGGMPSRRLLRQRFRRRGPAVRRCWDAPRRRRRRARPAPSNRRRSAPPAASASAGRARRVPGSGMPCPAAGRSGSDCRRGRCRVRPGSRRARARRR